MSRNKQNHKFILAVIFAGILSIWLTGFGEQLLALRFLSPPPPINCNTTAPPYPPSDLKVSNYGNGQVLLTWVDHSNDEYGFEIWRSLDKNSFNDLTNRVPENVANYIDEDANNNNFWYRVRAWNECGDSQFTSPERIYIPQTPLVSVSTTTPTPSPTFTLTPTPTYTPQSLTPTPGSAIPYVISSGVLGVRTGPGQEYETIRKLTVAEKVEIIGRLQDNSWLKIVCYDASLGDGCWIPNDPSFVEVINIDKVPVVSPENFQAPETITPTQTATSEPEKTNGTVTHSPPVATQTPPPSSPICPSAPLTIGLFASIGFVGERTGLKEQFKKSKNR